MRKDKRRKIQRRYMKPIAGALAAGVLLTASGCEVPFLSSVTGDYVFKVGKEKCPEREAKIILLNYQKAYSSLYGVDLWEHDYGEGNSLEDYVKELTVSQLAEVYTLDIIAEEQEMVLSDDETAKTETAAKEFMDGLSDEEQEYLGVGEGEIQKLFERYLLAKKLYTSLTESVSSEVSDDEARVMDMKQICVSEKETAETIVSQLAAGADFSVLEATYNEASVSDLSITRTTYDAEVSDQIFALNTGSYSEIMEIDGSYYIFYCVNAFNEALTQENKSNVLTQRMEDAVNSAYASYTDQLESELNEKVWGSVNVDTSLSLEGNSFMEIYNEYFGDFA